MLTAFLYHICSSLMSAPYEENKFTKFIKNTKRRFFKEKVRYGMRGILDGTALNSLDDSSVREFYSLVLQLFNEDQKPALIVKKYHCHSSFGAKGSCPV